LLDVQRLGDLRQLLWHRHRLVQMRTRIMNQLQALAMNEGYRCKKKLFSEQGREQLEKLAFWAQCQLDWFDHRFDLLRGPEFWIWQERGVLGMQEILPGAKVLDLCCGEGFYDRFYFANRGGQVDAIDIDKNAIGLAMALNKRSNLRFFAGDVVEKKFPDTEYDVILCFSALQQMSRIQLETLMPKIRKALKANGLFFGSVSLIPENDLLRTEEQVRMALVEFFQSVELNSLSWPNGRIECYFRCKSQ
jgi:2-polyprenyl-3-methyl-5-hydroxy-6-metoxy-1,4-benzoquinol methylase